MDKPPKLVPAINSVLKVCVDSGRFGDYQTLNMRTTYSTTAFMIIKLLTFSLTAVITMLYKGFLKQ